MKHILKTILLAVVFLFVFSIAKATTADDILKQITALQQQIKQLQSQLSQQKITGLEKIPATVALQKDLKLGDMSDDVAFSQRILKSQGLFCSKCIVTGYFGVGTKNALLLFQKQNSLPQSGFADSATREKLNGILQKSRAQATTNSNQQITNNPILTPTSVPTAIGTPAPTVNQPVSSGQTIVNSIIIKDNVTITAVPNITLALTCSAAEGVQSVRYANALVFTDEQFEPFSATKAWVLSGTSGLKTILYQCKDMKGSIATISTTIAYDATPPVRSNGLPTGSLAAGTAQATLSLTTDEPATCKYSTAKGTSYDAMLNAFLTTGGTSHAVSITGLFNGGTYDYYVRCKDNLSNTNFDDFVISFRVQSPTYAMNVLVLKYFPLTPDGKNIDINVTGDVGDLYTTILQRTIDITNNLKTALQKASTYLGYKDAGASPSLTYTIVDTKVTNLAVPTKNAPVLRYPDYFSILSSLQICNYVEQQNVNEVWLFAYSGPAEADGAPYLNGAESKMAGPFGDISNSYRYNDMPTCKKVYRVYTFNYGRGTAEAMESWGHQMEAELDAVNSTLFRNAFQGVNYPQTLNVPGRCGSVHNPPNARYEYDRANPTPQASDCLNWNPDTLSSTSPISCQNWGCQNNSDSDNPDLNYMVWSWQNLPGLNNTKTYQGKQLRNWWDVHGDFYGVMENNPRLTIEP